MGFGVIGGLRRGVSYVVNLTTGVKWGIWGVGDVDGTTRIDDHSSSLLLPCNPLIPLNLYVIKKKIYLVLRKVGWD